MTGFNGGLALTGVEGAVLLVLLVLFVREGGCAACGGAGLCACCDCLDESLRRPADADVVCGAECGDGVVCFESASVCLSWAPSKAWRTSSSFQVSPWVFCLGAVALLPSPLVQTVRLLVLALVLGWE